MRPLLVRFGAMGDPVLIQPMIRLLAARYGAPVDLLAAGGWVRPLYQGQPDVGEIHLLAKRKLPLWLSAEKRQLLQWLRQTGPRPVWYCDFDEKLVPLLAQAGMGERWVVRAKAVGTQDGEHLVDFSQRLARTVPPALQQVMANSRTDLDDRDPNLRISAAMQADVQDWLQARAWLGKPLLLVQAGNRRTMRTGLRRRMSTNTKWWPEDNWAAIIRMLAERHPDAVILLVGAPPEADLNDELLQRAGVAQAFNVARELPIPRLLALQSRAAGMVTVDTGPAHTAAAVGCPLVVLFGVADPVRIRPRGGNTPVEVLQAMHDGKPDMTAISVEAVVQAWQRLPLRQEPTAKPLPARDTTVWIAQAGNLPTTPREPMRASMREPACHSKAFSTRRHQPPATHP
ncbi:glycosyltransferase family 9 protein [Lautropia mirabilis]